MIRNPPSLLMAALMAGAALAGCSEPPPGPAPDAAAAQPVADADVFRFRIGALEAVALKDGDIELANDGSVFGVGQPTDQVAALLTEAGLPADTLHLSIQPLLVRSGARILLFDTGAGDADFARAGRLPASLRQAGVDPSEVTDVFVSHAHPDHIGGLLTGEGAPAFPNAAIHLSAPEWSALQARAGAAALVAAIAPQVAAFEPGAAIIPGVVAAVAVDGHTAGHSAYEIGSGDERLLYVGDTVHHHVVSVRRPEWTLQFDGDAPVAEASRRALLQRAADEGLRIHAVHFPFPGLGHVQAGDDGFVWVPEG
ncbi:MBL fold metallo-hydrolase [Pseudoxanthomonas suwonensis]|uniref:Beta-lactamase n=1 Tax=Pseudoxanthomonas suwonensis TaxID=314722 RepID=A0A0E3Z3S5_9GAMM|nr:MBL fold metallo-hydrolase [Pseudoxanthomonas suwonensis]AKC88278.1 beta-lactamase [Pseudoxanthomonas suwonensis]